MEYKELIEAIRVKFHETCLSNKFLRWGKPMNPYTLSVIGIIKGIPEGCVMTYGQIAELAGSPGGARQVVRILHSLSKPYELPWHRVVNAKGEIVIKNEEFRFIQMLHLQNEGVVCDDDGRVDLKIYRFIPDLRRCRDKLGELPAF